MIDNCWLSTYYAGASDQEEAVYTFQKSLALGFRDFAAIQGAGHLRFPSQTGALGIECQIGHPANIRAAEPRKRQHDRRDGDLILTLLVENRFPSIWLPSKDLLDHGQLRHPPGADSTIHVLLVVPVFFALMKNVPCVVEMCNQAPQSDA